MSGQGSAAVGERARGSDYAELSRLLAEHGLHDRRPGYYAARIGLVVLGLVGGWWAFATVGESWWQLLVAVGLAIAFGQAALLAHDLAHRQVLRARLPSEVGGLLAGNLAVGMSYGWWMDKHTRHHANPNHTEHDPDVAPGVLAWTPEQAAASRGVLRGVARWQAYLFFPLLTLEALNLRVSSVQAVLGRPSMRHRRAEAVLLAVHVVGYVSALVTVLSPGKALVFAAVHQGLFGLYLGCTFAPNHKGMPMLGPDDRLDYLRRQVLTSRNVRGGRLLDVALGGLGYQIEHHLFPNMPTPNLRRARPLVRAYCERLGVPYRECGLVESYREALGHLHSTGAPLRDDRVTSQ